MTGKKHSMRLVISTSFIVLLICTVSIIVYIVFGNWKISINDTIKKMQDQAGGEILNEIEALVNIPLYINNNNHTLIEKTMIDIQVKKERTAYFAGVVQANDEEIYSFSYGTEDGDYYGARRNAFGHETGDKLLHKIASVIQSECRKEDVVSRFGGDEFVILLPGTGHGEAQEIVERIMERCSKEKCDPIKLSISMGFASKEEKNQRIMDIYEAAEDIMYNNKLVESKSIRNSIITSLQKDLYKRSNETEEHSSHLTDMTQKLGEALGLSDDKIRSLKLLALLRDIGIACIPDYILSGNSGTEALNIMKSHCEIGYRIASSSSDLAHIAGDILGHHERFDGSGYPPGPFGRKYTVKFPHNCHCGCL